MRFICKRDALLGPCQLASAAIAPRDMKPVLRNLKAVVERDTCTLLATDLDVALRLEVAGVTVEETGAALLPAQRFLAILKETTDEDIRIEADDNACLVRSRDNEFEMPGEDPQAFPDPPAFKKKAYHQVQASTLRELIRRTSFAAAIESPRYAMNGTLWELEGNTIRLVATDGRRLAVAESSAASHGGHDTKNKTHVVPTKAMGLLERNLNNPDQVVRITLQPNEAVFQTDHATIHTRLVEGRYPNYRDVFPKKTTTTVPLTVGPFLAAVRQAALMAEENHRVLFTFDSRRLTLQAQGADTGRAQVEMALDAEIQPMKIAFDGKLLTDMLRVLPPETVLSLEIKDGNSPARFRCGDSYSYIVMPLA